MNFQYQTGNVVHVSTARTHTNTHAHKHTDLTYDVRSNGSSDVISAWSVFVRIWGPCQVAVGAVILVGPVGGAAVVLGIGRGAVVLVRAGLNVAAVVFRHLQKIKGGLEITFSRSNSHLRH